MLAYFFIIQGLFAIGAILYFLFFRNRMNNSNKKWFWISLAGLVFLLPFIGSVAYYSTTTNKASFVVHEHYIPQELCLMEDPLVEACYSIALTEENFCNCDVIKKENIVAFQENKVYDAAILNLNGFGYLSLLLIILFSIALLIQLLKLNAIVKKSKSVVREFNGKKVHFLYHDSFRAPGAFKLINSYIIYPSFLSELSPEEEKAVLYHELGHLQNHDTLLKIIVSALKPLFIINPLFHLAKKEFERIQEFLADDYVLTIWKEPKRYAELLLTIKTSQLSPIVNGFKNQDVSLKERLLNILSPKEYSSLRIIPIILLSVFTLSSLSVGLTKIADEQFNLLNSYAKMKQENLDSGKTVFCAHCMLSE